MRLRRLQLRDFRSYESVDVVFDDRVTLLVGANAHGKTNLLEAAHRIATGSSHRVGSDEPLVRAGTEAAYIRVWLTTDDGRRRRVEMELRPGRGTTVRVDGQECRRTSDGIGVLRVVLFAPEDVSILRGGPAERRRFLDDLLAQRRPAYAATLSEYRRVLRQRNQLLKSARQLRTGGSDRARMSQARDTLEVWTEQLIEHGVRLVAARIAAIHALTGPTNGFYGQLIDRPQPVRLAYASSAGREIVGEHGATPPDNAQIAGWLRGALAAAVDDEIDRGTTLVGPHRDDVEASIRGLPARDYASQGQVWSLALALRLATYEVLAEVGERPVVLLDDVFAELDDTRRRRLAGACERWTQVLVTAAVEADVPLTGTVVDVGLSAGVSHATTRAEPDRGTGELGRR